MITAKRFPWHSVDRGLPGWRSLSLCLLAAAIAGCATGDFAMLAPVAGGGKIRVPLKQGGAELTNVDGVQVNTATFTLNPDKRIVYVFAFTDSRSRALRSVRVEDVSDDTAVLLVDDLQPKLSNTGQWHGEAPPLELADAKLGWLATISNSLRVFRLTLTFADGRTVILHQGALYPAAMKAAVRQALGQKY